MLLRKLNLWQVRQQHSATVSVSSTQLQRKCILFIFNSFILYSNSINANHNGWHLFFTLGQFEGEALEKLVNMMIRIRILIYKIRKPFITRIMKIIQKNIFKRTWCIRSCSQLHRRAGSCTWSLLRCLHLTSSLIIHLASTLTLTHLIFVTTMTTAGCVTIFQPSVRFSNWNAKKTRC